MKPGAGLAAAGGPQLAGGADEVGEIEQVGLGKFRWAITSASVGAPAFSRSTAFLAEVFCTMQLPGQEGIHDPTLLGPPSEPQVLVGANQDRPLGWAAAALGARRCCW